MTGTLDARAAVLNAYAAPFDIEDVRIEPPRAKEVRVRMVGSGVCHTDLTFAAGKGVALPTPCVLGHEGSGVVDAVGAEVHDLKPGDHVVLSFNSCGACATCEKHQPAYCHHSAALNYTGRRPDGSSALSRSDGPVNAAFFSQSSFATYAIAARRNTVKVTQDAPLELLGPLGCGVQTGAGAVTNALDMKPGETLAIFGGGAVGLSALIAAVCIGAGRVIVVEPHANRRALALELGASHVVDPRATPDVLAEVRRLSGGGVGYAIDTTGLTAVIATVGEVVGPTGKVALIGLPQMRDTLPMNMASLMMRGVTIKSIVEGDADPQIFIPKMIELYLQGRFPFDKLIGKFPFEDINAAVRASEDGEVIKPVLIF